MAGGFTTSRVRGLSIASILAGWTTGRSEMPNEPTMSSASPTSRPPAATAIDAAGDIYISPDYGLEPSSFQNE